MEATTPRSRSDGHAHLQKYTWLERLDAESALLFIDRFAETAARWASLLADYRPTAESAPEAPTPDRFVPV